MSAFNAISVNAPITSAEAAKIFAEAIETFQVAYEADQFYGFPSDGAMNCSSWQPCDEEIYPSVCLEAECSLDCNRSTFYEEGSRKRPASLNLGPEVLPAKKPCTRSSNSDLAPSLHPSKVKY